MNATENADLDAAMKRHPAGSASRPFDQLDIENARSVGIFCTSAEEAIEAALVWLSARAGQPLDKQAHYADCAGAVLAGYVLAVPPGTVVDLTPLLPVSDEPGDGA